MPLDTPPIYILFCLGEMPTLQSAALPAASWECHWCRHTNNAENNKRHCFSCRGWRDGIAPLTSTAIVIANKEAGCGQPWQFVAMGDVPTQTGAQRCNDHIARRPDAIVLTAPRPHVNKGVPAGTTIADELILLVGSCHFIDENAAQTLHPLARVTVQRRGGER
jgi:hypothetical protein